MADFAAGYSVAVAVPLYGFRSNSDRLRFSDSLEVVKYQPELTEHLLTPEGSRLRAYLQLFAPEFVLWGTKPPTQGGELQPEPALEREDPLKAFAKLTFLHFGSLVVEAGELVSALRLWKQGEIRRGGTWVVGRQKAMAPKTPERLTDVGSVFEIHWEVEISPLYSRKMDWAAEEEVYNPVRSGEPYHFQAEELPFFRAFAKELRTILLNENLSRKLSLPLAYYNKTYGANLRAQLIDLFTCLESLLMDKTDKLTYRLALRSANLLGTDATERKQIYQEVKSFYQLRSKLVHGGILNEKDDQRLQQLGTLREYVRRLVLSVMGLASSTDFGPSFYELLDEMSLDETARKEIREKACTLLHLRTEGDGSSCS